MGWIVGGIAGAMTTAVAAMLLGQPTHIYNIDVNDIGIARPNPFFEDVRSEGTIRFDPSDLQDMRICEYKLIRGDNLWSVFIQYLDEYDMCFITNELGEKNIKVRANQFSNQVDYVNGVYYCKCSPDTINEDQARLQQ